MGVLGAIWGVFGVVIMLAVGIVHLSPKAWEAFDHPFFWYHWLSLAVFLLFMSVAKGYMGFQRGFSPRVAARARWLRDHPAFVRVILAPLFCMCYFRATRKRMIVSYGLTGAIVFFIVMLRITPQPWKGIVDAGVVLGLSWGLIAMVVFVLKAFTSSSFDFPPDLPEGQEGTS